MRVYSEHFDVSAIIRFDRERLDIIHL